MGSNDRSNIEARGWLRGFQGRQRRQGRHVPRCGLAALAAFAARAGLISPELSRLPYRRMSPAEPVAVVPSDAALIAAWQGGDEQAAAELVRRHARALARFLAAGGAVESDVDDLVQETFIRAFRAVGKFRGQCRFRTWLLTIGGNVLKDSHRRARRTRVEPLGDDLRTTDGDPHERAVAGEAEARLLQGLRRLPRMQREVFLLRAQQGCEYEG